MFNSSKQPLVGRDFRTDTKNGCKGDYVPAPFFLFNQNSKIFFFLNVVYISLLSLRGIFPPFPSPCTFKSKLLFKKASFLFLFYSYSNV
jgi:hypothetical protein